MFKITPKDETWTQNKRDKRETHLTFWKLSLGITLLAIAIPLSTNFPSALPVTQACVLFYRACTAVRNTPPSTPSSNLGVISCDRSGKEPIKRHLISGHWESEFELEPMCMWSVSPAADSWLTVKMTQVNGLECHRCQQAKVQSEMCVHSECQ